jgi:hypothetical protein
MEAGKRCCQECGTVKDESDANFPVKEDGSLSVACIECVASKQRKLRVQAKKAEKARAKKMKEMENVAVAAMLQNAVRGGANIPHSAELLEQVMTYFGGVSGFSALLVKQYFDSKPGSSQRGRAMEMVVRLVSKNVDQGGAQKPLTLWSEDELESELNDRFRRVVLEGRMTDGEEASATDSDATAASESHIAVRNLSVESTPDGDFGTEDRGIEALSPIVPTGLDAPMQGE